MQYLFKIYIRTKNKFQKIWKEFGNWAQSYLHKWPCREQANALQIPSLGQGSLLNEIIYNVDNYITLHYIT